MNYFLDTEETIVAGAGFSHYDAIHIGWLVLSAVVFLSGSLLFKKMGENGRCTFKRTIAFSLIIMEALKILLLIVTNRFVWDYLPFHLCGINIFLIFIHAWKPSRMLDNFLYLVCIPGALAALLFPSWTELPLGNIYHIHSSVVHILLVLYPLIQAVNGGLDLKVKYVPRALGLLALMAIPTYGLNLLLDTNFMFLMYADSTNPLSLFEKLWGSHLLGFPVIIAGVVIVMYLPVIISKKLKKA